MAQVEMCFLKKGVPGLTSQSLDLSEQQVMDCAYNGKTALGCQGATLDVYQVSYKEDIQLQRYQIWPLIQDENFLYLALLQK